MIPELDKKSRAVVSFHRSARRPKRRRTWSFKKNARLNALLPPELRHSGRSIWTGLLASWLMLLLFRA